MGSVLMNANAINMPLGSIDHAVGASEMTVLLNAAASLLHEQFGLTLGRHVAPLGVSSPQSIGVDEVHFVLLPCWSEAAEVDPLLLAASAKDKSEMCSTARWLPMAEAARAGEVHRALACWATPLLAQRAREAAATDLSGLWSRDASLNVGVEEALLARGLSAESAAAEATRAYVQQWRRTNEHDDGSSWQVTTFDAGGAGAHRTLIYSTGDWTEDFSGTSTLHGGVDAPTSPAVLVRRTSWMLHRPVPSTSRADAEVAAYGADSDHGAFRAVPPASLTGLATHTTWTSRTNDTGEIVCRYLHDGAMIVRRTQLKRRCGQVTALTVSEETFVRLLEAAPPAGDVP